MMISGWTTSLIVSLVMGSMAYYITERWLKRVVNEGNAGQPVKEHVRYDWGYRAITILVALAVSGVSALIAASVNRP